MSYLAEWFATIARAIIGGIILGMTPGMPIKERARATVEAGYRAFRFGAMDLPRDNSIFNTRERINHLTDECAAAREGVGKDGDWIIDFHQRFDLPTQSGVVTKSRASLHSS